MMKEEEEEEMCVRRAKRRMVSQFHPGVQPGGFHGYRTESAQGVVH